MAKFSEKLADQIVGAVPAGTSFERAARVAGVDRSTLWRWVKRGQQYDRDGSRTKHAAFYRDFSKANAEVISRVEQHMVEATAVHWQAGAWWLQRRAPHEYGDLKKALRHQLANELMDFLRPRTSAATFHEVLGLLNGWPDGDPKPQALPVPAD